VVVAGWRRLAGCGLQLRARGSDTSTDWHADADGDADIVGHGRSDASAFEHPGGHGDPGADRDEHGGGEWSSPDVGAGAREQLWLVDSDVQLDGREWGDPVLVVCRDDGGRKRSVFAVDRDEPERDGEWAADDGACVRAVVVADRGRLAVCRLQLRTRGSDTSTDWHADADGDADIVGHG